MTRLPAFPIRFLAVALAALVLHAAAPLDPALGGWFKRAKPTRMVLLLAPAPVKDNGHGPHQGILCRVYFFAGAEPTPMKVKGDLAFSAYDRSKPLEKRPPDGLYEIPADRLPSHLRKDIVGDSYLFWLPFQSPDATGAIVQGRFETAKGHEVVSSIVSVDLMPTGSVEHTSAATASPSRSRVPLSAGAARSASRREPVPERSRTVASDATLRAPSTPTPPVATLGRPRQGVSRARANGPGAITRRAAN